MAIIPWNPWPELRAMQEQMTRLLEQSRERARAEPLEQGLWEPPVDIYEDENEVVVKVEIPEIDQEDIDVQIEEHSLIIQGVRRLERSENRQNYQRIERNYGNFRRVFSLSAAVAVERTSARCEKGVLKIVLPKKEQGKPRQIEITLT